MEVSGVRSSCETSAMNSSFSRSSSRSRSFCSARRLLRALGVGAGHSFLREQRLELRLLPLAGA